MIFEHYVKYQTEIYNKKLLIFLWSNKAHK